MLKASTGAGTVEEGRLRVESSKLKGEGARLYCPDGLRCCAPTKSRCHTDRASALRVGVGATGGRRALHGG